MEYVTLSHQLKMPILGLGVFQVRDKRMSGKCLSGNQSWLSLN